jgi:hypothetical protein
MWAALRRYATLIPEPGTKDALDPFLEFLVDPNISTRGVALESLTNIFSTGRQLPKKPRIPPPVPCTSF